MNDVFKRLAAKLFLSPEARHIGESMVGSGYRIKETKVPSLTGTHNVYELEKITNATTP